jgi:integrase
LVKGIDPSEARKSAKVQQLAPLVTFRSIAEELLALQIRNCRAGVTVEKTKWLLEFAYPTLGNKRVTEIRPPEILDILRSVESRGRYETARRLRSTIGRVFRFAAATGRAESDPTYVLKGTLATPPVKSHAAITDAKAFGALLRAIDGFDGQRTTLAGLKLMSLLFPRPGELRAAEWTEFDTENAVWTIPAARTKLRRTPSTSVSPGTACLVGPTTHHRKWPIGFSVRANDHEVHIGKHVECSPSSAGLRQ